MASSKTQSTSSVGEPDVKHLQQRVPAAAYSYLAIEDTQCTVHTLQLLQCKLAPSLMRLRLKLPSQQAQQAAHLACAVGMQSATSLKKKVAHLKSHASMPSTLMCDICGSTVCSSSGASLCMTAGT
eukprot:5596-Heterococcus_DN1.PRE.2